MFGKSEISAGQKAAIRLDWTVDEIVALHQLPLLELVGRANEFTVHTMIQTRCRRRACFRSRPAAARKNCAYCPQSAHHREVSLTEDRLMDRARLSPSPRRQRMQGGTFLHGGRMARSARWQGVRRGYSDGGRRARLGMEACVTLGMLKPHHAARLAAAGLNCL